MIITSRVEEKQQQVPPLFKRGKNFFRTASQFDYLWQDKEKKKVRAPFPFLFFFLLFRLSFQLDLFFFFFFFFGFYIIFLK